MILIGSYKNILRKFTQRTVHKIKFRIRDNKRMYNPIYKEKWIEYLRVRWKSLFTHSGLLYMTVVLSSVLSTRRKGKTSRPFANHIVYIGLTIYYTFSLFILIFALQSGHWQLIISKVWFFHYTFKLCIRWHNESWKTKYSMKLFTTLYVITYCFF